MKFQDLDFKPHPNWGSSVQAILDFPNGYSVSVIQGPFSYGGPAGLYELAVLHGDEGMVYDTPITDDVVGYQTPEEIEGLMAQVAALPVRTAEVV